MRAADVREGDILIELDGTRWVVTSVCPYASMVEVGLWAHGRFRREQMHAGSLVEIAERREHSIRCLVCTSVSTWATDGQCVRCRNKAVLAETLESLG